MYVLGEIGGKPSHFKSDPLPFPSHLCFTQLTDTFRNSVFSNFETGAGASGDAVLA